MVVTIVASLATLLLYVGFLALTLADPEGGESRMANAFASLACQLSQPHLGQRQPSRFTEGHGRAEIRETDDLRLLVVKPDQYRNQIIELVSADAKATAAKMGADYAVQ